MPHDGAVHACTRTSLLTALVMLTHERIIYNCIVMGAHITCDFCVAVHARCVPATESLQEQQHDGAYRPTAGARSSE